MDQLRKNNPRFAMNTVEKMGQRSKSVTLLGLCLLVISLVVCIYFGRTFRLVCEKSEIKKVNCSGQIYLFNILPVTELVTVSDIQSIKRDVSCLTTSETLEDRCFFNVLVISSPKGNLTIRQEFLSEISTQELAEKIRNFQKDPERGHIEIAQWNPAILLGGLLCVFPPFFLFGVMLTFEQVITDWVKKRDRPNI